MKVPGISFKNTLISFGLCIQFPSVSEIHDFCWRQWKYSSPTQKEANSQIRKLEIFVPGALAFLTITAKELSSCLVHSCLHFAILLMTKGDFSYPVQKEHECQVFVVTEQRKEQLWYKHLFLQHSNSCSNLTGHQHTDHALGTVLVTESQVFTHRRAA